jgi:hypothetical protein
MGQHLFSGAQGPAPALSQARVAGRPIDRAPARAKIIRMKKQIWYVFLILFVGCIPSLHALYTDKDVIYDPALVGTWYTGDGQANFVFTRADDKSYKAVYTDKDGKTGEFTIHLLQLKDTRFLDFYPLGDSLTQSDFFKGHLVPAHSFMRVYSTVPDLVLGDMDYDWTKNFLAANPAALAHELIGEGGNDKELVLTASTADLQAFVLAHMNDDGFFKPNTLMREQPATRP